MSDTHSIRSFREVLRAWRQEFPESSIKEVREYLSCVFVLCVVVASDYNRQYGPRKDTDFCDNKRVLDSMKVTGKKPRARALAQMKALDRLHLKGHAQTTAERVRHLELLVGHITKIPAFGEGTARAFVRVFFYGEQSADKRIQGWQKFFHVATYWVHTGKSFSALRRALA